MKKLFFILTTLLITLTAVSQDHPLWMRYPAISPDGSTLLFCYQNDIFSVPAEGGEAVPLTLSDSYEFSPVWSHDGKWIAFASDRYGNFDVFIMPAKGGEAKRLTFHSTAEIPSSFTADDRAVLFSAHRQDLVTNVQFPSGIMSELYRVPVSGGRVSLELPVPALNATLNSTGSQLIYEDVKGYESPWRKHHTSSVTRDIWLYNFKQKKYTQLSSFKGEDRNPVFAGNNNDFYYLSEQTGSFNITKSSLSNPSQTVTLTHFTKHPVRFLTRASNNTLCFSYHGEIYTLTEGGQPTKVAIRIATDGRKQLDKIVPVNAGFTEASLSPNGKEFAYVFRGEIFVSSIEGGITKRITNTPWQERFVSFSPDGRSLVYAAEKDQNWNVYQTTIVRKEEPYFFAATLLKEEPVIATPAEEYQPRFSPDGKEVAYLENRVILKVVNLNTKKSRLIMPADKNYSYADGDQYYQWSPDGKWFLVQFGLPGRIMSPEVGLVSSDGKGTIHNLTLNGYNDYHPKWNADGNMMTWASDRKGTLNQGGGATSGDIFALFFNRKSFDRFNLSKEEFALLKEKEQKANKKSKTAKKDTLPKPVVIDWNNLTDRWVRITTHTAPLGDWVLSKDGAKLYYLTRFSKGLDIWVTDLRKKETKQFAKLSARSASMERSKDGKFLFLLAGGKPMKVEISSGKTTPLKTQGEMILKPSDELAYIFDHAWRQFKEKFYVPDLQGVDWDFYYKAYKPFLPYINNNYDFAEMLSEMLGEVNASHTGCRYSHHATNGDQTASLGIFYDWNYTGDGLKIAEIIEGGPLDKAAVKIKPGDIIEKIDGQPITASVDFYKYLNRKTGKLTLLSIYDPKSKTRWDETCKPVSLGTENQLLYQRWVKNRRAETEKLSRGKIGYVHVRAMNDASMRTMFEEALGRNLEKEALIVDTRFNGGGNIHEQLSDFLNGKKYFDVIPHGQNIGYEPSDKWIKPSIVLIGESNYSDAHLFPVAYKLKKTGKTLGMPVPGTGTFVWWERQIDPTLVFGIPMGGWRMPDGRFCENNQLEPDIKVQNLPSVRTAGRDQQIEAAVKELLKKH
ncbi:MAG: PD40 domain-containing protein [Bacteroidales bacterium]|nr:PD40 domain-containing protein [Bacteroidales bacterium]